MLTGVCLVCLLAPHAAITGYLLVMLAASLWPRRAMARAGVVGPRFAILIPAHNEETVLGATLAACARLDYPAELHRVFVIADHCDDGTADLAVANGASCFTRLTGERGKGAALAWGIPQALEFDWDALLVLDADCQLRPDFLRSMARELADGAAALQGRVETNNPDETPATYTAAVGNRLENDLFYAGKSRLGLGVTLRGTGMVFRRDVLTELPWQTGTVAEDAEFTRRLNAAGYVVRWVRDARLTTRAPANRQDMARQRQRWAAALRAKPTCGRACWRCLDAWLAALSLSRPLVVGYALLCVTLAAFFRVCEPSAITNVGLSAAVALTAVQGLYFFAGCLRLGLSWRRLALLARVPLVVLRLGIVTLVSLLRQRQPVWKPSVRGRP